LLQQGGISQANDGAGTGHHHDTRQVSEQSDKRHRTRKGRKPVKPALEALRPQHATGKKTARLITTPTTAAVVPVTQ